MLWILTMSQATAQAPGGFDAHGFRLATAEADVSDPLTFVRPGDQQIFDASVGLVAEYASRPVTFVSAAGGEVIEVQDLMVANVALGFVPYGPLRIGAEIPVMVMSDGISGSAAPGLGDVRGNLMAQLFAPRATGGFGLGLVGDIGLPTGDPSAYFGEYGVSGGGGVVGTLEVPNVTFAWAFGGRFSPNTPLDVRPAPTRGGDLLQGGTSMAWRPSEAVGVVAEVHGTMAIDPAVRSAIGIPAEALLSTRYASPSGAFLVAGIGTALGRGAGASPIRGIVGAGFSLAGGSPPDDDGDGLANAVDQCPDVPETANGHLDDDGCADVLPDMLLVATLGGEEAPDAEIVVSRGDGTAITGTGQVRIEGGIGERFVAVARLSACRLGQIEVGLAAGTEQSIPIGRATGVVQITIRDAAGRLLDGATARYLADDPDCDAENTDVSEGRGFHAVGAGSHTLLATAPGYDIHQQLVEVLPGGEIDIDAVLAPTQVRIVEDRLELTSPIHFPPGTATLVPSMHSILAQIATVVRVDGLQVRISGFPDPSGGGRELGRARADAVVDYLEALGVPRPSMTPGGEFGARRDAHIEVRIVP